MRTILILVDGMRPDSLSNIPVAQNIIKNSISTLNAKTVMPSMTLPCHMSLFHSVDPDRHGTTTNTYTPQVRPIKGLCELIHENGKKNAFFYNWEELRDLSRPGSLDFSYYFRETDDDDDNSNDIITNAAIEYLNDNYTDFAFLYLGFSDVAGHNHGWMSEEYLSAVKNSWDNIARVISELPNDYTFIITADHGGHDRGHGTDMAEDMTIPVIITGNIPKDVKFPENVTIKDISPTVAKLTGIKPGKQWEGKSLL